MKSNLSSRQTSFEPDWPLSMPWRANFPWRGNA